MGKGPEAGRGKAPWKDHSDISSEGRGWQVVWKPDWGRRQGMPEGHAEAFLVSCLAMFLRGIRHLPKGVKSRQTRRTPPHISPGTLDSEPPLAHPGKRDKTVYLTRNAERIR